MGLIDTLRGRNGHDAEERERFEEIVRRSEWNEELLQERIAELELAMEDDGWQRLGIEGELEFSRDGLDKIIRRARLMFLAHPLIRRSVLVQRYYVFGQGMQIAARDDRVNAVLHEFWDARRNRQALTGHQARSAKEETLQVDGNVFIALFTNASTGRVEIRSLPVDEIRDVIANPQDRLDVWYYKRVWNERTVDLRTGVSSSIRREAWYPDWEFAGPSGRHPGRIGSIPVHGDSPLMHVKVGGTDHMRFGVPDFYAAMNWASAYKSFLEDWHSIIRSLSRFAWRAKTKGSKVGKARKKLETTIGGGQGERNPPPVTGGVFVGDEDTDLTPIPKTGAQVKANDGRQLRLMIAAGTDIPDTMLANDPNMGNLATARTLDRPTELAMRDRQQVWRDTFSDLADYVITQARTAPNGKLRSATDADLTVDVSFPPILERNMEQIVKAIVSAATLGGKPMAGLLDRKIVARELLVAIGIQNVDKLIADMGDGIEDDDE